MHTRIRIHPLTLPVLGLVFAAAARTGAMAVWALFFAVISHEMGHLFFLALFRVPIDAVTVSVCGVRISAELSLLSYAKEAVIAVSGAAVNLLCGVLFSLGGMEHAAIPSLLLGFYNLLPLTSFDGGRVLAALLCAATPLSLGAVHRLCHALSLTVLILLYLFCGWYFWAMSLDGAWDAGLRGGVLFFAVWGIFTEQLHAASAPISAKK